MIILLLRNSAAITQDDLASGVWAACVLSRHLETKERGTKWQDLKLVEVPPSTPGSRAK